MNVYVKIINTVLGKGLGIPELMLCGWLSLKRSGPVQDQLPEKLTSLLPATKGRDFITWFPISAILSIGLTSFIHLRLKFGCYYSAVNRDGEGPLRCVYVLQHSQSSTIMSS